MKKSQRMTPIRDLAENHENKAANQLGQSRQQVMHEQQRLEELIAYRDEYLKRFSEAGKAGMSGSQLQQYQKFIQQLDAAIAHQQQRISDVSKQCEQARQHWQQKHNRTQALGKTIQRYQHQERYQEERKEQRELEDTLQSKSHHRK